MSKLPFYISARSLIAVLMQVVQQTMAKLSKQFGTSFGAKARAVSKAEMEKMQKEGKLDEL